MTRWILLSLVSLSASTVFAQPSGDQVVKVIAAARTTTPAMTLQQIANKAAMIPSVWRGSSYDTYRPFIAGIYGYFYVPTQVCRSGLTAADNTARTAYVDEAIMLAQAAGVMFAPTDLVLVNWDCGHLETLVWSGVLGRSVMASDGKVYNTVMGLLHHLSISAANNVPPKSVNNWNDFTPMGWNDNNRQYTSFERLGLRFLTSVHVLSDVGFGHPASNSTNFIESLEKTPSGAIKRWNLSNFFSIEVRDIQNPTGKPVVHVYQGGTIQDLHRDSVNPCYQYALPVGQIFAVQGLGIRTDSIAPDHSGAIVSVFPYIGPSTVTCQGLSKQ